jgi:hypothetical protein
MLFFILCLLLATCARGTTCTTDNNCYGSALTTNPAWVRCNTASSTCECVADRGYVTGNATTANKCRCDAPNQLTADQGQVYCFSVQGAVQAKTRCERNKGIVEFLYGKIVYPFNIPYALGLADASAILAQDVIGRVNPLGQWVGFVKMVEYFFGIALSEYGYVGESVMRELICEGDITYGRVDLHMNFTLSPIAKFPFNNITQIFRFVHDPSTGAIKFAHISVENLGAGADVGPEETLELAPGFFLNKREIIIGAICNQIQASCVGEHQKYADIPACVAAQSVIPWGTWNRANDLSFVCHQLHTTLVGLDPAIHCPHVAPDGGDACHVFTQQSYYTEDAVEPSFTYNKVVGLSPLAGSSSNNNNAKKRDIDPATPGQKGDNRFLGYYVDAYIAQKAAEHQQQQQQKRTLISEKVKTRG